MNKSSTRVAIGLTALLIVLVGLVVAAVLLRPDTPTKSSVSTVPEAVVQITDAGFTPATLTVKKGTKVRWENATAAPHSVASNPYPERTDLPGLYSGAAIAPGENYEYTFAASGTWGYHDSTNPVTSGTVEVK